MEARSAIVIGGKFTGRRLTSSKAIRASTRSYTGTNSLPPWPQSKETFTTSAFLGLRLWDGGELYYNPELLQGFGLSSTVGAAGFPNGEAQKSDFIYPHYNTSRLFLRQNLRLRRRTGND